MTIIVHGFLHLPEAVKNLGPLWAHSCFAFEAADGELLQLFHGSQAAGKQVYTVMMIILSSSRKTSMMIILSLVDCQNRQMYLSHAVIPLDLHTVIKHTFTTLLPCSCEEQIIISSTIVVDKYLRMDLSCQSGLVFVSCLPNIVKVD